MNEEDMPQPEAIWLALGIIVWALAIALAPTVRRRFVDALERLTEEHDARATVVELRSAGTRIPGMTQALRLAIAWLRRLVVELREVRG